MKPFLTLFFFLSACLLWGQPPQEEQRLLPLRQQLDSLVLQYPKYSQKLKIDLDFEQLSIADFLQAIAQVHQVNITLDPILKNRFMTAQFTEIHLDDLLFFLCKNHRLTLNITGNIVYVAPYIPPPVEPEAPLVLYFFDHQTLTLDVKNHALSEVFKQISQQSPYNLLFTPDIAKRPLQMYIEDMPIATALTQLASLHQLKINRSKEGFFLFEAKESDDIRANVFAGEEVPFTIFPDRHHFSVHAVDYPIGPLIEALVDSLDINWYQASPLKNLGQLRLKMDRTTLDELLPLLFSEKAVEQHALDKERTGDKKMTYKKENDMYFFGSQEDLLLRKVEKIVLQHRTVSLLDDPYREQTKSNVSFQNNFIPPALGQGNAFSSFGQNSFSNLQPQNPTFSSPTPSSIATSEPNITLIELIPEALREGVQIQIDKELNALLVLGTAQKVERLHAFVQKIDLPVPVILIEVMLIEVNRTAELDTGISWGIGEAPVTDQGRLFPDLDHQLGASTVNRILGGYSQLTALNLGKLQPNFFLQLKALEESGTVKVLSSPKMATLNGHRAVFSNSEISYYAYTAQNFYGFQNPQTSEITNYIPISAGLTLSVKPHVTGDDGVTLDLFVQQSAFNNKRVSEDAPPGIESREFSSIVRMRNKDIAILGGLEQNTKNNAGQGVPFLARIPLIKWLFSRKSYARSKRKLTVLIQPTLIQ